MNQQQEARRAAAQAFMESLEQLQQTLESEDKPSQTAPTSGKKVAKSTNPPTPTEVKSEVFDLNVWAEAIADIDQFIEEKNGSEG